MCMFYLLQCFRWNVFVYINVNFCWFLCSFWSISFVYRLIINFISPENRDLPSLVGHFRKSHMKITTPESFAVYFLWEQSKIMYLKILRYFFLDKNHLRYNKETKEPRDHKAITKPQYELTKQRKTRFFHWRRYKKPNVVSLVEYEHWL